MRSIHAFWLVAVAAADRIAMSPVQFGASSHAQSARLTPTTLKSNWLKKTLYAPTAGLESKPTTLMPAAMAAVRSGATASLSSAEMMIELTCWVVRSLMNGTCRSAVGDWGPTWMTVEPDSAAPLSMPTLAAAKYWLTIAGGGRSTSRSRGSGRRRGRRCGRRGGRGCGRRARVRACGEHHRGDADEGD